MCCLQMSCFGWFCPTAKCTETVRCVHDLRVVNVTISYSYAAMDLHTPLLELLRLVRLYSSKWNRKALAMEQLHSEYDKNKRHLDVALKRISVIGIEAERNRKDKLLYNWELLFAKLLSYRRHGRRWQFLIDSFHDLMREDKLILVESDPEDKSDDSDDDHEQRLPQKSVPKQRRANIKKKDLNMQAAVQDENEKLQFEIRRLKAQMDDFLSLKPTDSKNVQTEGDFVQKITKETLPFVVDLNEVFRDCGDGVPIKKARVLARPKMIRGFGAFFPPDISCVIDVIDSETATARERSSTTVPPVHLVGKSAHTIEQNIILTSVAEGDSLLVQLVSGPSAIVMASGSIPAAPFLEALAAQTKNRISDTVAATYSIETTVNLKLSVTREFHRYRSEMLSQAGNARTPDMNAFYIDFGVFVVPPESDETVAELQSSDAISDVIAATAALRRGSGRRKNRLEN
jgi:hypothetical protein